MKKIVFVSIDQFGYTVDFYNYCKYLKDFYQITFICPDHGKERMDIENVEIQYLLNYKSGLKFKVEFIIKACKVINIIKPDLVYINYFPICGLIPLFLKTRETNVDIRTGTIDDNNFRRVIKNKLMKYETCMFKYVSIISEGLLNDLGIRKSKSAIIPLGADRPVGSIKKTLFRDNSFKLLYVGTLNKRNIDETLKGFAMYLSKYKNMVNASYTLIGYSDYGEEELIKKTISDLNLHKYVSFLGRKKYSELQEYFDSHDIGVSYIPLKGYFQHQPPTKTYEYIQNGMVCIATETVENAKVIDESNGVLIKDNVQAFFEGLEYIFLNRARFNPDEIMSQGESYTWHYIVTNILKSFIDKILDVKGHEYEYRLYN